MSDPNPLIALRETLHSNPTFCAVLKRSLRLGVLEVYIPECHHYNHPTAEEWVNDRFHEAPDKPRADGHYDIEGYDSCDIYGHFSLNLLNYHDLWIYLKAIGRWIKESVEFRSWSYCWDTCPLLFPWVNWTWTLTSFNTARYSVAQDRAERMLDKEDLCLHDRIEQEIKIEEKLLPTLTNQDVGGWLALDRQDVQISRSIWVNQSDPTVFCVNDSLVPFDEKTGWSHEAIKKILGDWFVALGYNRPLVRIGETQDFCPFLRPVRAAITRFKNRYYKNNEVTNV